MDEPTWCTTTVRVEMILQHWILHIGYTAIFLLVLGESAGLPIPGETALLIGSTLAGAGGPFHLSWVIVAGISGAILGDTIGYWMGRRGGRPIIERIQRRFHLNRSILEKTEKYFHRHGVLTVILSRFAAFLRILTPLLAGVSGMSPVSFISANIFGGCLWAVIVCLIGRTFGSHLELVTKTIHEIGWVVPGVIVSLSIAAVYRKLFR
jgi:membrane protein DedA with SNARE-associated domain